MCSIILITSTHLRHRYIAHCLATQLNLVGIVSEQKSATIQSNSPYDEKLSAINTAHFRQRDTTENIFFGQYIDFPSQSEVLKVENGEANSNKVFEWVTSLNPDYVVLFGSSIIKNPLLNYYTNKMINLHLGLSPYYRGAATNFFPLYDQQPECVGATIHLAVEKVDAGNILYQLRPDLEGSENLHEIGNKVIQKAGVLLPKVILKYHTKELVPQTQNLTIGKVVRNKDYSPLMIAKINENLAAGMLHDYLVHQTERNAAFLIVAPDLSSNL